MRNQNDVKDILRRQTIETPSWAYGNSGTRFKVFAQKGVAPSVAMHIPWDKVEDYGKLAKHASDLGIKIGAINPNVFQEDDYKFGSVCNPDPVIRRKATDHLLECVEIAHITNSFAISLWFADGTNYPGQDNIRARQDRLHEALAETYAAMGPEVSMLLEYKLYEPSFYTMDVPDWGTSLLQCLALGEKAKVLVDTGHHALATNIEFLVAMLLRAGKLGGFHFNSRFYGDDDLMVGAADPYQLFRIMFEIVDVDAVTPEGGVAFMLDQCHNIEPKVQAEIRSVLNVQEATAKALLVDREELATLQRAGDVLGANALFQDAFFTDVRPMLAEMRTEMGLDPDPIAAYRRSGYQQKIETERVGGTAAGWGA